LLSCWRPRLPVSTQSNSSINSIKPLAEKLDAISIEQGVDGVHATHSINRINALFRADCIVLFSKSGLPFISVMQTQLLRATRQGVADVCTMVAAAGVAVVCHTCCCLCAMYLNAAVAAAAAVIMSITG
jgi:vacuolar-type H+-ATPase subunit B/Vma2